MITKLFTLFIIVGNGTKQLAQPPGCLPQRRDNYLTQRDFLERLELLEEHSFIRYWYSYENLNRKFYTKSTSLNFITKILRMEEAKNIFGIMKKSFKKYMHDKLFKEFLGPLSKEDKEKLLFQAISLYQGRFRSVWVRLGKPGPKKFKNWLQIFIVFQRIINLGIYGSIETVFHDLMIYVNDPQKEELVYQLGHQFHLLIRFLSNCESEKYGLPWIAEHPDLRLILSFFLYSNYPPSKSFYFLKKIKKKNADRSIILEIALEHLQQATNFEINRYGEKKVIFDRFFRNPYSSQITANDLKFIISKIFSRLLNFCPLPQKFSQIKPNMC
jgi:hypothetical protein